MLERIHIFISLTAAVATVVYCVITGRTLVETAIPLIVSIIVFYFVGLFVRSFLTKKVFIKEEPPVDEGIAEDVEILNGVEEIFGDDDDYIDEDEDSGSI